MMLTQQGKAFATRLDHLSSIPRAPHGRRKQKSRRLSSAVALEHPTTSNINLKHSKKDVI